MRAFDYPSQSAQRGMTLVEALIAIFISTLLLAAMASVTGLVSDARRAGVARETSLNAFALASDGLQDPLLCSKTLTSATGWTKPADKVGQSFSVPNIYARPTSGGTGVAPVAVLTAGAALPNDATLTVAKIYFTNFVPIPGDGSNPDHWAQAFAQLSRSAGAKGGGLSSSRARLLATVRIAADGQSCGGTLQALSKASSLPDVPPLPPVASGSIFQAFATSGSGNPSGQYLTTRADPTRTSSCAANSYMTGVDFSQSPPTPICATPPMAPLQLKSVCNVKNTLPSTWVQYGGAMPTAASINAGAPWACYPLPGGNRNWLQNVVACVQPGLPWDQNWYCNLVCCGYNPNLPNVDAP